MTDFHESADHCGEGRPTWRWKVVPQNVTSRTSNVISICEL